MKKLQRMPAIETWEEIDNQQVGVDPFLPLTLEISTYGLKDQSEELIAFGVVIKLVGSDELLRFWYFTDPVGNILNYFAFRKIKPNDSLVWCVIGPDVREKMVWPRFSLRLSKEGIRLEIDRFPISRETLIRWPNYIVN